MPYDNLISQYSNENGLDPNLMSRIMRIESGGNPNSTTGSYRGLFQMSWPEFKQYGGTGNIYDPANNVGAAARKLAAESAGFRNRYGRDPTPTDIYMTHQQGEGGYANHMANPSAPAWENMFATGEGRQKGAGWAKQAIWGNIPDNLKSAFGSVDNVTSADLVNIYRNKLEGGDGALTTTGGGTRTMPALSARNIAGPGGMYNNDEGGDLGNALQGAAAWLMSPYNPKALSVLPSLENQGKWSFHVGPNGEIIRFNNKSGKPEVLGSVGTRPEYKDVETASGIKRPMIYQNGQLTPVPGAPVVDESITPNPRFPGEKTQDEAFAKENNLWTSGGFTQAEKAINQLEGVVKELKAPKKPLFQATTKGGGAETFGDVLGPTGPVAGALPDWASSIVNPKAVDLRDRVGDIIQRGAKAILGSQYTQREGTQLTERAYNPRLSPEINAQRLETTLKQMKEQAAAQQAKSEYFKRGTLKGYVGAQPDFNNIGVFDEQGSSLPEGWSVKVK